MIIFGKKLLFLIVVLTVLILISVLGVRKVNHVESSKFGAVSAELSAERTDATMKMIAFRGLLNEVRKKGGDFFILDTDRRKVSLRPSSDQFKATFDRIINYSEPTNGIIEFQREYKSDSLDFVIVPYENIMSMIDFLGASPFR